MIALKVGKEKAGEALDYLFKSGLVDRGKKTHMKGDFVLIPLSSRPPENTTKSISGDIVEHEWFSPRKSSKPMERIKGMLAIPEEMKMHIPQKWELVGDILIFKLHPSIKERKREIAEVYASVLKVKAVFEDISGIKDEFREPEFEKIIGEGAETIHKENGVLYKLDAEKLMFSSGNKHERMRMAEIDMKNEIVVDMFAGIGYFSLPIAKYSSPKRVVACEKNPLAFHYLLENARLNRLDNIKPVLKDCRELEIDEKVDRIIMGYVKDTHLYLPKALELIKSGGIIHYHEVCPIELLPDRPIERMRSETSKDLKKIEVKNYRVVKSYAPKVEHVVLDVVVS